jgi:prepilin-type N-terminal cleavage/methylation domain-containing protein/prepilin-type processing-associated H-X9-DG protein
MKRLTQPHPRDRRSGFTLIELLVVVAIIALLISILLPSLQRARDQAKTTVCLSNGKQFALSVLYYAEDRDQHLPYVLRWNGRSHQYHQIIALWEYMQDLDLYICPSADAQNSVTRLFDQGEDGSGGGSGAILDETNHYYFVRKTNDYYQKTAFAENWWPEHDPTDIPTVQFPGLYTEYWFNDFESNLITLPRGYLSPLPKMNGGQIGRIPAPQYAVPFMDHLWNLPVDRMRHGRGLMVGFLDGHAEILPKEEIYDLNGRAAGPNDAASDYDAHGNRPVYAWGLTKRGWDFLR